MSPPHITVVAALILSLFFVVPSVSAIAPEDASLVARSPLLPALPIIGQPIGGIAGRAVPTSDDLPTPGNGIPTAEELKSEMPPPSGDDDPSHHNSDGDGDYKLNDVTDQLGGVTKMLSFGKRVDLPGVSALGQIFGGLQKAQTGGAGVAGAATKRAANPGLPIPIVGSLLPVKRDSPLSTLPVVGSALGSAGLPISKRQEEPVDSSENGSEMMAATDDDGEDEDDKEDVATAKGWMHPVEYQAHPAKRDDSTAGKATHDANVAAAVAEAHTDRLASLGEDHAARITNAPRQLESLPDAIATPDSNRARSFGRPRAVGQPAASHLIARCVHAIPFFVSSFF
jgi:hypothetical protein